MSIDKDVLLNSYIPFNVPVPYKDWKIYPIKLIDKCNVDVALSLLELDKNILGQIDFINMSNLRFILLMASAEEKYFNQLNHLLRRCLNISDDEIIRPCIYEKKEYLMVGKSIGLTRSGQNILQESEAKIITAEDFDEIRRIVLFQNILDYTDEYVDPDVRKATEEYHRLKNKDSIDVPLEHQMICVQMKTGMSMEAIGNLTVRNFQQLFSTIVEESDYSYLRIAECNGAKFKKPIEHWAYKKRKNKYEEAFCDADSFKSMVQSAN